MGQFAGLDAPTLTVAEVLAFGPGPAEIGKTGALLDTYGAGIGGWIADAGQTFLALPRLVIATLELVDGAAGHTPSAPFAGRAIQIAAGAVGVGFAGFGAHRIRGAC